MSSPAVQFRSRMPRVAEAAVERARLTVVPRRRVRAARMPFVLLVTVVLLGGVVGLLLVNTSMQQGSFAATALEEQATALSAREQSLQMELETLRDPQHVAVQARKMGMVTAGAPVFLRLSDGKVLGQPTVPDPAQNVRIFPPAPKLPAVLDPAPKYVDAPATDSSANDGASTTHGGGHGGRTDQQSHKHHQSRANQ
ncbi:hypothetical protein [Nocardioides panaciterrulae]|uniref:Cell division protein FtsB n=1 Tax=Nocardioides panaciterrulae TaxID=661492 RepID=A0A7Y9E572_9ACTN|nr:hypothetical protein [Nocardioides panaciterrulae]NYD41471.1 cell division protein FtsB [Nocardioides panaciterrulae]